MSNKIILGIVLGLLFIGGGGYVVYSELRGIRNNNPGNIEDDGFTNWEGLDNPRSDGKFLRFISPLYGIRAIYKTLENYIVADGIPSTVTAIITRWAPPPENDTAAYIAAVIDQIGSDSVDLSSESVPLIAAIIQHEQGIQPYSSATISQAISMA